MSNKRAYLYRAVLSVANDHHRSTLSRRLREMKTASPESTPLWTSISMSWVLSSVSRAAGAAVLLTYWADLPAETVADRMGISTGAVKRHLARARKHLEEWLS